jgi:hypothetical protein
MGVSVAEVFGTLAGTLILTIIAILLPNRWKEWFVRNRWRFAVFGFGTLSAGLTGVAFTLVISPWGADAVLGLALSGALALAMAGLAIYAYANRHDY